MRLPPYPLVIVLVPLKNAPEEIKLSSQGVLLTSEKGALVPLPLSKTKRTSLLSLPLCRHSNACLALPFRLNEVKQMGCIVFCVFVSLRQAHLMSLMVYVVAQRVDSVTSK